MYIESIQLKNFRNYESLELEFDQGTNILYGDNAQGKTNILESIYLCGTSKSHRGSKDKEMIRFKQEESHIRLHVCKNGMQYKIDMHLKQNKPKGAAVNGIPIRKAKELLGVMNVKKKKKRTCREKKIYGYGALPAGYDLCFGSFRL